MRSIFRYPGGKSKSSIKSWILSHMPEDTLWYREPMVGGGGVFFDISKDRCPRRWINDLNEGLISVYQALRDRPDDFIKKCREIEPPNSQDELTKNGERGGEPKNKRMLKIFDELKLNKECDQALRYFYVNRTVFAGRVNYDIPSRLYFSNPNGWNITKTYILEQVSTHLQDTKITCGKYDKLLSTPGKNVWIFLDPPYKINTEMTKTSQLYQHNFGDKDHERLCDKVKKSPHKVAISYDDDEEGFIRSLYSDFRIVENSWKYCGSTNKDKREGKELLILNY